MRVINPIMVNFLLTPYLPNYICKLFFTLFIYRHSRFPNLTDFTMDLLNQRHFHHAHTTAIAYIPIQMHYIHHTHATARHNIKLFHQNSSAALPRRHKTQQLNKNRI